MNFEAVDWKKDVVRGWGYRPDEYTYALPRYAPQPDIQAERYDVLVNTLTVFRSPGWEREREHEREREVEIKIEDGVSESGSESSYDDNGYMESVTMVHDFVLQQEENAKRQRIDEDELFQERLMVALKKSLFEKIFMRIRGVVWVRVVESGPYFADPHHYYHAHRRVKPTHVVCTTYPCHVRSIDWYPDRLRPQDVLTGASVVIDYNRYVLHIPDEGTWHHYDLWAYTRILKVPSADIEGRYEYFEQTY